MSKFADMAKRAASIVTETMGEPIVFHYSGTESVGLCAVFFVTQSEVGLGVGIDSESYTFVIDIEKLDRKPMQGDLITARNGTFEVIEVAGNNITSWRVICHAVDTRHAGDIV
jgi:hypothetical protein